ncbi:hypothetical protein [Pseudomonas sp. LB3P25]
MAHTMLPQHYYRAVQDGHDQFIAGHFYNGRFYDRHQFIGQIDDDGAFRYFEGQDNGRPTFPEHIAGHVQGLVLMLKDGTLFNLVEVDRHSLEAP